MNNVGFSANGIHSDDTYSTSADGSWNDSKYQYYTTESYKQALVASRERYNPYLRFYAISKLGVMSTASNTVPILVSISAGDDYEVSIPTVQVSRTTPGINVEERLYCQSSWQEDERPVDEEDGLSPQAKAEIVEESLSLGKRLVTYLLKRIFPKLVCQTELEFISAESTSQANLESCVGEKISDLRTIANRFTEPTVYNNRVIDYLMWEPNSDPNLQSMVVKSQTIPTGITLGLGINTPEGFPLSNYEAIALIYRFSYGGRRYKSMADEDSIMMCRLINNRSNYDTNNVSLSQAALSPNSGNVIQLARTRNAKLCSTAATTAVALNGTLILDSSINNIMEVERPFYSNRKLISTRYNGLVTRCTDDVLINFTCISKDKNWRTAKYSSTNFNDMVNPIFESRFCTIGPSCIDPQDVNTGNQNFEMIQAPSTKWLNGTTSLVQNALTQVNKLSTRDRTFAAETDVYNSTVPTRLQVRPFVQGPVLEALGTNAGFTFLQAPPCVLFG
jgi:hypothetical protein